MNAVIRSQWILVNRARTWMVAGSVMAAFTVVATVLSIVSAEPAGPGGGGEGVTVETLTGPGGATAAVIWALGFGGILILVTFIATTANEFTRGTFRAALLQRPGRLSFLVGKSVALLAVTTVFVIGALVLGVVTATLVAPGQGIDTTGWFGSEALAAAAGDVARLLTWAFGWAVIGTTVGVLTRSTPVALGVGVLWFGPFENIVAESQDLALRWFPGLLLRAVVAPDSPLAVDTGRALATLAAYVGICLVVAGLAVHRRDVTS